MGRRVAGLNRLLRQADRIAVPARWSYAGKAGSMGVMVRNPQARNSASYESAETVAVDDHCHPEEGACRVPSGNARQPVRRPKDLYRKRAGASRQSQS
jgi:hypothetical protein